MSNLGVDDGLELELQLELELGVGLGLDLGSGGLVMGADAADAESIRCLLNPKQHKRCNYLNLKRPNSKKLRR